MKTILRLEEAAQLIFAVYLSSFIPFDWWWYWVLFLTPDIGMLGYLINARVGAAMYNAFHHKGIALFIYVAGIYLVNFELEFVGLLLFGHSAFDRMLGYGLKYEDSFKHTHLGMIGRDS
jgi:hypothetical protein